MGNCQTTEENVDVSTQELEPQAVFPPAMGEVQIEKVVPTDFKFSRASVCPPCDHPNFAGQEVYQNAFQQHKVMSWLQWAPDPDSACYKALHQSFPGAVPGPAIHYRLKNILTDQKYGFTPANTLLGSSLCPDEINNEPGDLIDLMQTHWGHLFPLGGISGAPFVGSTGFKAFSHHVPDNGDIIVVYGPHVGISSTGEIGKCLREGQGGMSSSCGAVVGAYNACCACSKAGDDFDENDMQMAWIKSQLAPHTERIKATPVPLAALAYQAYDMVNAKMERIVNNDFGSGRLVLVGGVQINMPRPFNDHFLPLKFEIRQKGKPTKDLISEFAFKVEPAANQDINDKITGA
jgi:hypothetical protein